MSNLFNELKRRNVFRVAAAYLVISWLLLQVADTVVPALHLPDWITSALTLLLLLGFIPTVLFSWAYELTPDGLKKDSQVTTDRSHQNHTAKKLDVITLIAIVGVVALVAWQQMNPATKISDDSSAQNRSQLSRDSSPETSDSSQIVPPINNKSIAVLPFANMANNPENEPFTLGLHDDLLTHLSKISALKVISRTSVMEYKDTTKKIKDIAQELGVANILEGGVQRSGNQIRLNVQLIDAATDEHIWAEIYDRELTTKNIFDIQTEVSEKIAAALKAQLTPAESASLALKPTNNLDAYNAYLAARQLVEKRTGPALKEARALYQKAIELDPNYVLAYAGQAMTLRLLNEYSDMPVEESIKLAEPLIAKALALDPLSAEANLAQAALLDEQRKFKEAEKAYQYALSLNPNNANAYHWYGHMLRIDLGRAEEALVLHQKAAELDPLSRVILINVGWSLRSNNHLQEALQQFQKVNQLYPKFPGALNGLAWINDDLGHYAKAAFEQNRAVNLDENNLLNRFWLFLHYLGMDDTTSAKEELARAKNIEASYGSIAFQESMLDVMAGNYSSAQSRFSELVDEQPSNLGLKSDWAKFAMINNNCGSAIELWQEASPNKFRESYKSNSSTLNDDLDIAWCLTEMGGKAQAETLMNSIVEISKKGSNNTEDFLNDARLLAIQGFNQQAAQAYADIVASKRTRGWYWLDHLPYFAEVRKEPVFIQARQQLMQDLAEQRELLKQYQATGQIQ